MNGSKPITAAIYVRVSKEEQKYEMQLHDLRLYAQRQGWHAIEYQEKESSVKKRPVSDDARRRTPGKGAYDPGLAH